MSRTLVDITPTVDPWPIVDAWATKHSMKVEGYGDWGRLYKKGDGFWTAQSCVQVEQHGAVLRLLVWAPFWMSGQELEVHTSTPLQYFPRKKARKIANDLLAMLGAQAITSAAIKVG